MAASASTAEKKHSPSRDGFEYEGQDDVGELCYEKKFPLPEDDNPPEYSAVVASSSAAASPNMTTVLRVPALPTFFGGSKVHEGERTLRIVNVRDFRFVDIYDSNGSKLFHLQGKDAFTSWTVRRTLLNASGKPILVLRGTPFSWYDWNVEDPQSKKLFTIHDGVQGKPKMTLAHAKLPTDSGNIVVYMRSFTPGGYRTLFQIEDVPFAEMLLAKSNGASKDSFRGVWTLRIAAGVDTALVLAMALIRFSITVNSRR